MKKLLAVSLIALDVSLASCCVHAQFTGTTEQNNMLKGGYQDAVAIISTVRDAKEMNDDAYVTLRGYIEKRIKSDKYLFRDSTGTVEIEIDDDDWHGVTVGPQDLVEITGEVDRGWMSVKIDVKRIWKVQK